VTQPNNITVVAAYTAMMVNRRPNTEEWAALDTELKSKARRGLTLRRAMRELSHGVEYRKFLQAIVRRLGVRADAPLSSIIARPRRRAVA